MPQGKFKKAKLPASIQKKKNQKQAAFTRRSSKFQQVVLTYQILSYSYSYLIDAPIQAKKAKFNETQKIKSSSPSR